MRRSTVAADRAFGDVELVGDAGAGPAVGASAVRCVMLAISCWGYEPDCVPDYLRGTGCLQESGLPLSELLMGARL